MDDDKTLQEYNAVAGVVITLESTGAEDGVEEDEEAEFDDTFTSGGVTTIPAAKRPGVELSAEYKRRKMSQPRAAAPVVTSELDSLQNGIDPVALLRCFMTPDKITSEDRIGEMTFNMFTAAARVSALQNPKRDLTLAFLDGAVPTLKVNFRSNKKSYEDNCRFYPEGIIKELVQGVYQSTVTRSRRSTDNCRKMFTVAELSSRAPHILWSIAFSESSLLHYALVGMMLLFCSVWRGDVDGGEGDRGIAGRGIG